MKIISDDMLDLIIASPDEEALPLLKDALARVEDSVVPCRTDLFMPMFMWSQLAERYAPARDALAMLRDKQIERLLSGDRYFGKDDGSEQPAWMRIQRFHLIIQINRELQDHRSTYQTFRGIEASEPALALEYGCLALDALIDARDFARASRYHGDPLEKLDNVNRQARTLPLLPAHHTAPRLAADLTNLVTGVRQGMAILKGVGNEGAADLLRQALLVGIESGELRALAQRELDAPGTITREVVAHEMANDRPDAERVTQPPPTC